MERGLKFDWEYQYRGKNHSWRNNVYALHSENYIHLNPQVAPLLTIRGSFPHYIYESLPTSIAGVNLIYIATYNRGNFEISGDAIWGRIWNPDRYPTQIPPLSLRVQWQQEWHNWVLTLRQTAVARTVFYTTGTDLMTPPPGYMLSDAYLQSPALIKSWDLKIKIGIQNIFNSVYRDYLDRFRYFSPQAGRNFSIQISTNLHHHRNHQSH
jgi:iron complex outermembrane receptor protein